MMFVRPVGLPGEPTHAGIANLIGLFVKQNQRENRCSIASAFDAEHLPPVSICTYAFFLFGAFQCSSATALYTLIYLERAARAHTRTHITPYTIHRLFLSAFFVACKYIEDQHENIKDVAHVSGVRAEDLKFLEFSFLQITSFQLYVSQEVFDEHAQLALTLG